MKSTLVCHAFCSDPACESEHASTCAICGSKNCYSLDPVCACDEGDIPDDPDDILGIRARRALFSDLLLDEPGNQELPPSDRDRQPRRFMFRFTYTGVKA
jgi:hypothetical protein